MKEPKIFIGNKPSGKLDFKFYSLITGEELNEDNEWDHMEVPVSKALNIMTDEWIEKDQYWTQTIIDMREALKYYINKEKGFWNCPKCNQKVHNDEIHDCYKEK